MQQVAAALRGNGVTCFSQTVGRVIISVGGITVKHSGLSLTHLTAAVGGGLKHHVRERRVEVLLSPGPLVRIEHQDRCDLQEATLAVS